MNRLALLRSTLADYENMRARKAFSGMAELSLVAARRGREEAPADEALYGRVAAEIGADGAQGWARFRSALGWPGCPPPAFEEAGPPVAAEWLRGADADEETAWRLGPAPGKAGAALIVSVRHRALGPSDALAEGETACLRQRATVLAHPRLGSARIAYDIYWGLPENGDASAMRRLFDRFAGFAEHGEGRRHGE